MPTTYTLGMDWECDLDVEVSWGPAFVNITGNCDGAWMLYSMRPVEGLGQWQRLNRSPPLAQRTPAAVPVYTDLPNVSRSGQRASEPSNSSDRIESVSSGSDSPPVLIATNSQEYPAVDIIEEAPHSMPFAITHLRDIPFSRPRDPSHHPRRTIEYRPITVQEFDPHGMLPFELALEFVREENRHRHTWYPAGERSVQMNPSTLSSLIKPLIGR